MERRAFVAGSLALLAAPLAAAPQQPPKIAKLGVLFASSRAAVDHLLEAFRQGLRELGHVEGKTVVLEPRYGGAGAERLSEVAHELVRLKADVIVASTKAYLAALNRLLAASQPIETRELRSRPNQSSPAASPGVSPGAAE